MTVTNGTTADAAHIDGRVTTQSVRDPNPFEDDPTTGEWSDPLTLDYDVKAAYDAAGHDPEELSDADLDVLVDAVTDAGIDARTLHPEHPITRAVECRNAREAARAASVDKLAEKMAVSAAHEQRNSPEAVAARLAATLERDVLTERHRLRARNIAATRERQEEAARQRGDNPRAQPVSLADALAAGTPEVDWMITGLWKRGTNVVLSGPYKRGKSAVIAEVAAVLADGGRFMGQWPVKPSRGRLLIVDTEQGMAEVVEVLGRANIANVERVRIVDAAGQAGDWDLTIPENMDAAVEIVRSAEASVLVIDPLAPIFTAMGIDENSAAVQQPLEAFATLARRCNLDGVLISHHSGHGGGGRTRGNSAIPGWPAALWNITVRSEEMDAQRYFDAYGRGVNVPRGEINLTGGRLTYTSVLANTIEERISTERIEAEGHRRWAIDAITEHPGHPTMWHTDRLRDLGKTEPVIVALTTQAGHPTTVRVSRNGLDAAIKRLEADGWIRNVSPQKNRTQWVAVPEDERPAPHPVVPVTNPFTTPADRDEHDGDLPPDGAPFTAPVDLFATPNS